MKKICIITTHPIQYYAPVFKVITQSNMVELKVFYTWGACSIEKKDPGFNRIIEWDIPLFDGYNYEFLLNTANDKGTHHFNGIINPDIIQRIDAFKPNFILIYGWCWNSHLKVMRHYKNKVPIWFKGDSTLLLPSKSFKQKIKSIIKKPLLKWIYSHVNKAFYVGINNKLYFLEYGMNLGKMVFAPHAIDNIRFATDRIEEAANLRKTLSINGQAIIILFAGKFEVVKNPKLLLKAFLELKENYNVHLLFVGNGLLKNDLTSITQHNPNVHFIDFQNQSQMPVIYQACDLFCLPSQSETWGLAVNEAMACGKAVLVSDKVGCAMDLVKPGINGDIFQADSIRSLTEKLAIITKNRLKLMEFGKASREIIQSWSFQHVAETIINEIIIEKNR
jgi:glycosyltransferase involved in cell wall biosynthesis